VAESDELETPDVATAEFACYRLRKSEYSPDRMKALAELFTEKAAAGDVYAYFKHEDEPTGALRAVKLRAMLRKKGGR
jgi:uncharacterized protein YecE (DUF72 family)